MNKDRLIRSCLLIQGNYYFITGAWPLVSYRTFEMITGKKTDDWLVKTLGSFIAAMGVVMILGGLRRRPPVETPLVAILGAWTLSATETYYALRGRISRIYLLDALLEIPLSLLLLRALLSRYEPKQEIAGPTD